MGTTYKVPAGHRITVTAGDGPAHARQLEDTTIGAVVYSTASFGPYMLPRTFVVNGGTAVVSEDATVIADLLTSGAGAPDDAAQATASVNPTGDDNGLTFTAVEYGTAGNSIAIRYVDPVANDAALSVSVAGTAIEVSLATDGGGTITTTAAEIITAIAASTQAARLVVATVNAGDSGAGDDGSGVVTAMAWAALSSGAGTGIGRVYPGGLYIDTENGDVYRNSGTRAAPVWTQLADVA